MKHFNQSLCLLFCAFSVFVFSQNPLVIPPALTGTSFDLNVQTGQSNFFANPTNTYGINGNLLAPTIIVNKGDIVTLNVINNLPVNTTMHWHGLHVAPENDGGPHQNILAGSTWSPSFEILNKAGTFWYHPHGHGKTELHVSKGLAGMFIIHDAEELALGLPQTYGVDDIPIIVQSKAFDVLQQIAIADHMDTVVMVNGVIDPFVDLPAQIVRLRLLNGSSMRAFNFGFSNGMSFYQIATDGGLMAAPLTLSRLLLAPGERAEILVDLTALNGQSIDLMCYGSEMPNGIFGAPSVGVIPDVIHEYENNFLNGADYKLMAINVINTTSNPVTSLPTSLVPYIPFSGPVDVNRRIVFDTLTLMPGDLPNLAEGPFGFNRSTFNMDIVNEYVTLDATEVWTLVNKTHIAHPFHIHDIQFNIIEKSGTIAPPHEQGWKDVVLVPPHDSVKFITKFTTFTDDMVPYMYHCHLLHHEDDGMMGSFLVRAVGASIDEQKHSSFSIYPNPSNDFWSIELTKPYRKMKLLDALGKEIQLEINSKGPVVQIGTNNLSKGVYYLSFELEGKGYIEKVIKE